MIGGREQRIGLATLGLPISAEPEASTKALGWSGAPQPDAEVCFFRAGGMVVGLCTALGGHGAAGIELAHNVRSPEAVTEALQEAERAGGSGPGAGMDPSHQSGARLLGKGRSQVQTSSRAARMARSRFSTSVR